MIKQVTGFSLTLGLLLTVAVGHVECSAPEWRGIKIQEVYDGCDVVCIGEVRNVSTTGSCVYSPVSKRVHVGGSGSFEAQTLVAEMRVRGHAKGSTDDYIQIRCHRNWRGAILWAIRKGPVMVFLDKSGDEYRPHDDYAYYLPISRTALDCNEFTDVASVITETVMTWSRNPNSFEEDVSGYTHSRRSLLQGYVSVLEELCPREDFIRILQEMREIENAYARGVALRWLVRSKEYSYLPEHIEFAVAHKDEDWAPFIGIYSPLPEKCGCTDERALSVLHAALLDESCPRWLLIDGTRALSMIADPKSEKVLQACLSRSRDLSVQYLALKGLWLLKNGTLKGFLGLPRFKERPEEYINQLLSELDRENPDR